VRLLEVRSLLDRGDLDAALAALAAEGEGWSYALDGGRWVPSPDTRRAPGLPALGITLGSSLPASPCEAH